MKEIINFSTKFESLEMVNPLITKYRINICVPDKPANKYKFSKEVIEGMSSTIRGAGVYAYYFERENQIGGHEDDVIKTKYGYKRTGKPVAYGFADPYKEPYWEEKDGEQWYTADVYLWTGRNPEIEEVLDRPVYQSMEVAVDDEEDAFGNKVVKEAVFLGFCLLQGISPAFEGSTIEKFSLPDNNIEINLLKQEFSKFASKYDDLDFTIPSGVKKTAQRGLDLRKEFGRGGTSVGLATARYLVKNSIATPEKARHIAKYFPRHAGDNLDDKTSNGWIAWQLWGGNAGRTWSNKLVDAMNKRDEEKMSYFSKDVINNESIKINNSEVINNIKNKNNEEGDKVIKEAVEKFSLTSDQIREILRNALVGYKYTRNEYECNKYYVDCYDAEFVYVCDNEDDKTYSFKYDISENVATVDMDSKKEVIRGGFISVGENKSELSVEEMAKEETKIDEELKEELSEEKSDVKTEEMSSNEYVDNTAMQELNDKSAEDNKELSDEQLNVEDDEDDKDKIIAGMKEEMSAMQEKLSKYESDMSVYMAENSNLKEFKSTIEKQNKDFSVESTLNDVMSILPKEEIDACRLSADNFSLENIDIWKNEVKAKAFNFSKGLPEKKSFIQVALPNTDKPKGGTGLWD